MTTSEWQYTATFKEDFVKISHQVQFPLPYGFRGLIAIAKFPPPELYGIKVLYPKLEGEIFNFPSIAPIATKDRKLAVRGQVRYKTSIQWTVNVDVWR
ncbi:MAG: hypothetical protein ACRC2R_25955 [Xenococcaceae cyanobacterium]